MGKLNAKQLAFAFAGGFLGAGFVSGQELWQFFGCFGLSGVMGLIVTNLLIGFIGISVMRLAVATNKQSIDEVVVRANNRFLRNTVAILQCMFLVGVSTIMLAAGAALLNQLFKIPLFWGGALFAIIVTMVGVSGIKGLVSFFSCLVPIIVLATTAITFVAGTVFGMQDISFVPTGSSNQLLPNWFISTLTYTSYNILATISIHISIGHASLGSKQISRSVTLGTGLLISVALFVLTSLFIHPSATSAPLPMLELACNINPMLGTIYGLLLLGGMFSSCLASLVALTNFLSEKDFAWFQYDKKIILISIVVVCFLCSLYGFGTLVSTVYPIFGYSGFIIIACIIEHVIYRKKHKQSY